MKRIIFIAVIGSLLLSSCVDGNYSLDNGIDGSVGIDGALGVPLVKANIKLVDMLPENFGDFMLDVDGEDVFLRYSSIFDVTSDFVENVHFTPAEEFTIPIPWMPEGFNVSYETPLVYHFLDINQEGDGQRLDSLLYADGQILNMYMNCDSEFAEGSYLRFKMNPEQVRLNAELYPDNTVTFPINGRMSVCPIDLSGAKVIFDGGDELVFTLELNLKAAENISDGNITNYVDFATVFPKITYGVIYEGTEICHVTEKEPFTYVNDLQEDDVFLPVYNPVLNFNVLNSIGVKADYILNYVKVNGVNGEQVYADFGGSPSTIVKVESPELSQIENISDRDLLYFDALSLQTETLFTIDRDNGHTERLFTVMGESIEYDFSVVATEETHGSFLFSDSKMLVDVDSYLPLRFEGDKDNPDKNFRLVIRDTVDVDLSGLEKYFSGSHDDRLSLELIHRNHLPVDTEFTIKFLDADKKQIPVDADNNFVIDAAPVNESGEVTETSKTSQNEVSVQGSDCSLLVMECRYMEIVYKIDSGQFNDVWFHTNDWLELQIGAFIKGSIFF